MKTKAEFESRWPGLMADIPCGFGCPKGWSELVWKLFIDIEAALTAAHPELSDFKIAQIKEKFGGLRFYFSLRKDHPAYDMIHQLVEQAQGESFGICLSCGGSADVTTGVTGGGRGWVTSQCQACRDIPANPRTPRNA